MSNTTSAVLIVVYEGSSVHILEIIKFQPFLSLRPNRDAQKYLLQNHTFI